MAQPTEVGARDGAQARVLGAVRAAIIAGHHLPGAPLSEIGLAESHGVSRTPVREALKQLQIEGLVEVRPRVGTFVRAPSRREVIELFEIKEVLEGMGARLLAARGRVTELDRLVEIVDRSRAAVAAGDPEVYADLVHDFHSTVIDGADNSRLKDHYRILMNQLAYHRLVARSLKRPGRLGASLGEHESVLRRIQDKDGVGAEMAMRDHVRSSERETLSTD